MFKVGDLVVCKDRTYLSNDPESFLIVGRHYKVIKVADSGRYGVGIQLDGSPTVWSASRFNLVFRPEIGATVIPVKYTNGYTVITSKYPHLTIHTMTEDGTVTFKEIEEEYPGLTYNIKWFDPVTVSPHRPIQQETEMEKPTEIDFGAAIRRLEADHLQLKQRIQAIEADFEGLNGNIDEYLEHVIKEALKQNHSIEDIHAGLFRAIGRMKK